MGAGEYSALYPKSWYDYQWKKFPAHVVLEQFSPVLPNNYRESSYPVAVYRWHADNPTDMRSLSLCFFPGRTWGDGFAPLPTTSTARRTRATTTSLPVRRISAGTMKGHCL